MIGLFGSGDSLVGWGSSMRRGEVLFPPPNQGKENYRRDILKIWLRQVSRGA